MKNKWYDDWNVQFTSKGGLKVSIPNSFGGVGKVEFRSIKKDARIEWLAKVLDSALWELSERDKKLSHLKENNNG